MNVIRLGHCLGIILCSSQRLFIIKTYVATQKQAFFALAEPAFRLPFIK